MKAYPVNSPEAAARVLAMAMLAGGGQWTGTVDAAIRDQLMGEITDRGLQDLILLQCETLMLSDGHLADGEVELLDALSAAWRRPVLV